MPATERARVSIARKWQAYVSGCYLPSKKCCLRRRDTIALAISDVSMHDNVTASIMYSTSMCDAAKAVAYTLLFQGTMSLLESETTSIYPAFASPTAATRAKAYRLYTTQKRRAPSYFYCGSAGGRPCRGRASRFAEKISGLALVSAVY